jgi:hypothetical protein
MQHYSVLPQELKVKFVHRFASREKELRQDAQNAIHLMMNQYLN